MRASEMILWAMLIAIIAYPTGYVMRYVWEDSKPLFFGILTFLGAVVVAIAFRLNGN